MEFLDDNIDDVIKYMDKKAGAGNEAVSKYVPSEKEKGKGKGKGKGKVKEKVKEQSGGRIRRMGVEIAESSAYDDIAVKQVDELEEDKKTKVGPENNSAEAWKSFLHKRLMEEGIPEGGTTPPPDIVPEELRPFIGIPMEVVNPFADRK